MNEQEYLQQLVNDRLEAEYPYVQDHIETSAKVYPRRSELWKWSCEYAKYLSTVHRKTLARDVQKCAIVWLEARDKIVQSDYDTYFESMKAVQQ